jgi:hypothetical protein
MENISRNLSTSTGSTNWTPYRNAAGGLGERKGGPKAESIWLRCAEMSFIYIIGGILGIIVIFYTVFFMLFPMHGVKKKEEPEVAGMIPLPELNERAQRIADHVLSFFQKKEKIDLRKNPLALRRVYDAAIKAEGELRTQTSAIIKIPFIVPDDYGPVNLDLTIYRELFDE